jgi:hypothetical protein
MAPLPEDDAANGVVGDCMVVSAVVGDHVTVWVANDTVNVTSRDLVEYALVAAAVERTTQLPAAEYVNTPDDKLTEQPVVPAEVTE